MDARTAARLSGRFRAWLAELSDEQAAALAGHWENVMDDAALDRVGSWVIAGRAIAVLHQDVPHDQETGTGDQDMGLFPRRDPSEAEPGPQARNQRQRLQMRATARANRRDDQRPTEEPIPPGPLQREGVWTPRTRRP
jgi:hypothetical protein